MDPSGSSGPRTLTIQSPKYPKKYENDLVCTWRITATSGTIKMLFSKFNVEANSRCAKDYLQVSGPIRKYRKVKICGTNMPSSFNLQSSKKTMIIKFVSNGSVRKTGFRATLFANG